MKFNEVMRFSEMSEPKVNPGKPDDQQGVPKNVSRRYHVALVGNPNCGKTTLFNRLTGSRQHVGNWSGVTIEKKTGECTVPETGEKIFITDLPGIYSLIPYSAEEKIAGDFIFDEKPDLVIDIVDATNLERNLFLTLQMIRRNVPVIIALNMMDEVEKNGDRIDIQKLSQMLGVPIVPISAVTGGGFFSRFRKRSASGTDADASSGTSSGGLSGDGGIGRLLSTVARSAGSSAGSEGRYAYRLSSDDNETSEMLYTEISAIMDDCYHAGINKGLERSYKIDRILTHKYLGIPIFIGLMLLIFQASFGSFSTFLSDSIDSLLGTLASFVKTWFESAGTPEWMRSLVIDGIFGGVGSVLSFLPQIAILFLFLTLMEDSGYMARVAFIMDRLFRKIGLSGKSFISMIIGFGCSVPAVMASRTIADENDRKATILVTPFMSCSARLPIYAFFVAYFFTESGGLVMSSLYILGILVAVFSALLLKKTIFRGGESLYILELPPYRMPVPGYVLLHVWDKVKAFVIRAGTILFTLSVIIWFLQSFDLSLTLVEDSADSIFGTIGHIAEPLFAPIGCGDWRAAVAFLTGMVAKESVVSALEILFTPAEIAAFFTPLTAYSFMVFSLLYMPCIAALATIRRELRSIKWTLFAIVYQTVIAYAVAFLIYQGGKLLGFS